MDSLAKLRKYLLIAFGFAWLFWWADAALTHATGMTAADIVPYALFTAGGFGPFVAALACLDGGFSLRGPKAFLLARKPGRWWYLLLFSALEFAVFAFSSAGLSPDIPRSPVVALGFIGSLLVMTLFFGGQEELGWRGTLRPLLNERMPRGLVPIVVALVWSVWHLPLWFIVGDSHQGLSFFAFLSLGIALSYWLASIYDVTDSVPACMLVHGLTNTVMGFFVMDMNALFFIGILLLTALAVVASIKTRAEAGTGRA